MAETQAESTPPHALGTVDGGGRSRALLAGSVVVALVVVAAVVALVSGLGGGDGGGDGWDTVVGVTDAGELVVLDADGEELDRIDLGYGEAGTPVPIQGPDGVVVVRDDDADILAVVDLDDGEVERHRLFGRSQVRILGDDRSVLVAGDLQGGDGLVIDLQRGTATGLADAVDLDRLFFTVDNTASDPSAGSVALATGGPETAVVDPPTGEVTVVDGRMVGYVGDELVTVVDGETGDGGVRFHGPDLQVRAEVAADTRSTRFVVATGERVLAVDDRGAVLAFDAGSDGPEELSTLEGFGEESRTYGVSDRSRVLVTTDLGLVVLDGRGEQVELSDGLLDGGPPLGVGTRCLVLPTGPEDAEEPAPTVVDLEVGRVVATVDEDGWGRAVAPVVSRDGCTALVSRSGDESLLLTAEGTVAVDRRVAALADDGTVAVVGDPDEGWELVDLVDADSDPVPLPDLVRFGFARR